MSALRPAGQAVEPETVALSARSRTPSRHGFLDSVKAGHGGAPGGGCRAGCVAAPRAAARVRWPCGARSPPDAWTRPPRALTHRSPHSWTSCGATSASQAFVRTLPARARVSEPVLPLVLAALHEELGRGLLVLLPEDADARDAADGASWFGDATRVALPPEPRRHVRVRPRAAAAPRRRALPRARRARGRRARLRIGRRARRGSAAARRAAAALELRIGDEPGIDGLAEALALAGYERVDRVDERGQFAVRGGIVDVFPSTGREPLRVELFGDEIEQVRAFSPVHAARAASRRPRDRLSGGRAAAPIWSSPTSVADEDGEPVAEVPTDLVAPVGRPPDLVWQPDEVRRRRRGGGPRADRARRRHRARPVPAGAAARLRGAAAGRRRARARRGRERARGLRPRREPRRRRVRASRRGGAPGGAPPQGRRAAARARRAARRRARAPLRRRAGAARASSGASSGSSCCPTRRSSASGPRAPTARLGRALASFADLRVGDYVVHEDHGVGKLLGFETKEVAGVTRDYLHLAFRGEDRLYVPHEQLGKLSKYIGADADGADASRSSAARPGRTSRRAPGTRCASSPASCSQLYAQRQRAEGVANDLSSDWIERLEASFPYRETDDQAAGDRGRQGGPRVAAPDGPARLRRRRLRQDRGRRPRRVRRRRQRRARCSSSARRRSSPSSTGTPSASATATSRSASRWSRASGSRRR